MGNLQSIYGLHAHIRRGRVINGVFQHSTSGHSILDTPFRCKHVGITFRIVKNCGDELT